MSGCVCVCTCMPHYYISWLNSTPHKTINYLILHIITMAKFHNEQNIKCCYRTYNNITNGIQNMHLIIVPHINIKSYL